MNWKLMFKGDYIAAVELGDKQPTLTIANVKIVKMDDEKTGRAKDRGVVFFKETDRGWVLCKTNAICLAGMFGDDTTTWAGKRVVLYATEVEFGKERVPGIRVYGSPDLTAPVEVVVKLPRKKPRKMRMVPTGKTAAKAPPPEPEDAPQDESQPDEIEDVA